MVSMYGAFYIVFILMSLLVSIINNIKLDGDLEIRTEMNNCVTRIFYDQTWSPNLNYDQKELFGKNRIKKNPRLMLFRIFLFIMNVGNVVISQIDWMETIVLRLIYLRRYRHCRTYLEFIFRGKVV